MIRGQRRRDRDRLTGCLAAIAMPEVDISQLRGGRPGRQPPEDFLQQIAVSVKPRLQPLQPVALLV